MNDTQPAAVETPRAGLDLLGAVLSYLIPGLGQVCQGRLVKGLLFFVCLWGLFFYGLYLGQWQNVYFPPQRDAQGHLVPNHGNIVLRAPAVKSILGHELVIPHAPYIAQFCIGIAAWPAILQANNYDPKDVEQPDLEKLSVHPLLEKFERYPNLYQQETMLRNGDKSGDLGWVYTIIAGLLNVLVIYDALAGPAHGNHGIPVTTFLKFLVGLTVVCAVGFVAVVYLMLAGDIQPTLYIQLPIVLTLVSLVYSATRFERWRPILLEAVNWGWRMTVFLLGVGLVLYVVARPPLAVLGG